MLAQKRTLRRLLSLLGCIVIVLAGANAQGQQLPKIIVAGPPTDDFKTVYYGIQSGLFRKYGVDVQVQQMQSGAAALASVIGGSVQVAFTSIPAVLQGYARGVPFKIVAPGEYYRSEAATAALVVASDSSIRSGRDLEGKTVAVQSIKDVNWAATMAWIDQHGGDSHTVKVVELPYSAIVPAIEERRIATGLLTSPFLEQGLASGKVRVLGKNLDAIAKRFQMAVYVSSDNYIAANPDAVERFVRAMHDAIVYTDSHLAQTVDIVAAYSGVPAAVVAHSVREVDPEYIDPQLIQPVIAVALRYHLIELPISADDLISSLALRQPGSTHAR
jgi:NitT/TauT family transport system substrate-binding protein